jgi:uncharacterized protein involved in exopolysaccharide biosynthesis
VSPNETAPNARAGQGSARDFLAVLFRRRWVIGSVFAITTLTVLAINLTQPLYFESTGKVIVKRGVRDNIISGGIRTLTWEEDLSSEVETVKSGVIIQRAQAILNEERSAGGRATTRIDAKRVDAKVIEKSNVLALSYESRDPKVAQEVTDALLRAYMDYRKTAYTLQFPKEFFDSELARVTKELDEWMQKRERYMAATQTVDVGVQGVQDADFVRAQKFAMATIDQDLAEKRAKLASMKSMLAASTDAADLPFSAEGEHGADVAIIELKKRLSEGRARLTSMEAIYVPTSPELTQQRAEVEDLTRLLQNEVSNRLRVAQGEISSLEARRAETARSLNEGNVRLSTYPERSARITEYDTHIAALQKSFQDLSQSSSQAKISKATSPDWTVALLTPASKPYAKNQRDYVRLALAPIFSLIVGLGLAFFIDGLDATLKNPRETEEALELPVLATLTEQKRRRA